MKGKTLLSNREILMQAQGRECVQANIQEEFGVAEISKARRRLCNKCKAHTSPAEGRNRKCRFSLLPLTTDGSDCPYFLNEGDLT